MSNPNFSGQEPFRFWCQMVLPLIYDDSLSYYELLNKIVVYLNNTISDVAECENVVVDLSAKFDKLKSFVDNYFTNLDVQHEINNKLDEMAVSGELSDIVNNFTTLEMWQPCLSTAAPGGAFNLFMSSAGGNCLIDCGESNQTGAIDLFLRDKIGYGNKLQCVVLTHYDGDHAGGAPYIVENWCDENTLFFVQMDFNPAYFGTNGEHAAQNQVSFLTAITAAGYDNNVVTPADGQIVDFRGFSLQFFNTDTDYITGYNTAYSDSGVDSYTDPTINNFSLITYVRGSGVTFLCAADVEQLAQQYNSANIVPCDILQVPHHNQNVNGYFDFFQRANPRYAYFNYNTAFNTPFRYFSRYRRLVKDVPTVSTYGTDVHFKCANGNILAVDGHTENNVLTDITGIRNFLPLPWDSTHNGWEYNSWTITDLINMRKYTQGNVYTFQVTNSAGQTIYNKLIDLFGFTPSGGFFNIDLTFKIRFAVSENNQPTKFIYLNSFSETGGADQAQIFRVIQNTNNASSATSINVANGGTIPSGTIPNNQFDYLVTLRDDVTDPATTKTIYCHHTGNNALYGSELRYNVSDGNVIVVVWSVAVGSNGVVNALHWSHNTTTGQDGYCNPCTVVSVAKCW